MYFTDNYSDNNYLRVFALKGSSDATVIFIEKEPVVLPYYFKATVDLGLGQRAKICAWLIISTWKSIQQLAYRAAHQLHSCNKSQKRGEISLLKGALD